ncbi:sigma-70 family RNA polymerase sigma factor [Phenylobacterium sp.]|uniref:sigma-70 family RNA polymerase sigma factor n=1 Tax=Phenylobacterium sp. TaxID=1871053 RepID=UPI00286AD9B2|nr:sigma-70 family RNA polymerase sigma factor [Phenylobacterium sp.]
MGRREADCAVAATPDDAEDIVAVARGDKPRFEALFARFAPKVKTYLLRLGVAPAAAEELAQETMLNVWRRAHQFDPNLGTGAAWIFTIARNQRIDALRRERHPEALRGQWTIAVTDAPTPEDLFLIREQARRLETALADLSPAQMEVVRRSFLGAGPLSQVARDLDLPLATAKSHLRRAVARLKAALDETS